MIEISDDSFSHWSSDVRVEEGEVRIEARRFGGRVEEEENDVLLEGEKERCF